MKTFLNNNIVFHVGTSAIENWKILSAADKTDCWVHLEDHPSAHVIIEIADPVEEDLQFARALILAQTKKAPTNARIIYARVCDVKRGSKPGEVIVKHSRTSK